MGNGEYSAESQATNKLISLPPEQIGRTILRQQIIADNFIERIEPFLQEVGEGDIKLLRHQPPYIQETQQFFEKTRNECGRRILWPSPPNFGKTALSAIVAHATGIGEVPAGQSEPLRGLFMVPRQIGRVQMRQQYKHLAPHIRTAEFTPSMGQRMVERADMLVMTYKGSTDLTKSSLDSLGRQIDLLVLDEVHRGIGELTARNINYLIDIYGPTVLAMSATHKYHEDRSAAKSFLIEHSITPMTPRESIERGLSNGVQLFALHTGEQVRFVSKRDTITGQDIEELRQSSHRNRLIVDLIKDMVTDGRQGIAQCLPGSFNDISNQHAIDIAREARKQKIIDPLTKQERYLRVDAVGTHRTDNDIVIAKFKRGELDALTFSRYLVEMFDHPIRFIIFGAPTTSRVDTDQLVGRGARLSKDTRPTLLFHLLDIYSSKVTKNIQTPFRTFGTESVVYQGMVIVPKESSTSKNRKPYDPAKNKKRSNAPDLDRAYKDEVNVFAPFSASILEVLRKIPPGTVLEQELIVAAPTEVPQGYIPLNELPVVADGHITIEGATYALRQHMDGKGDTEMLLCLTPQGSRQMRYISSSAQDYLTERYQVLGAMISRIEINNFLERNRWPVPSFDNYFKECDEAGIEPEVIKSSFMLSRGDTKKLLLYMAEIPFVDPTKELPLSLLASMIDTHTSELHKYVKNDDQLLAALVLRRRGLNPQAHRKVESMRIDAVPAMIEKMAIVSGRIAAQVALRGIQGLLAQAQQHYIEHYQKSDITPTLSQSAIVAFTSGKKMALEPASDESAFVTKPWLQATVVAPVVEESILQPPEPPKPMDIDANPGAQWHDFGKLLSDANCSALAARFMIKMLKGEHMVRHGQGKRIEINQKIIIPVSRLCIQLPFSSPGIEWVSLIEAERRLRDRGYHPGTILPQLTQKLFKLPNAKGLVELYCSLRELNHFINSGDD